MWEKEKLLVTSNFSFSHSVFKRLVMQTCENQGLFGKGLSVRNISQDLGQTITCNLTCITICHNVVSLCIYENSFCNPPYNHYILILQVICVCAGSLIANKSGESTCQSWDCDRSQLSRVTHSYRSYMTVILFDPLPNIPKI